jgi:hypothetical protein
VWLDADAAQLILEIADRLLAGANDHVIDLEYPRV